MRSHGGRIPSRALECGTVAKRSNISSASRGLQLGLDDEDGSPYKMCRSASRGWTVFNVIRSHGSDVERQEAGEFNWIFEEDPLEDLKLDVRCSGSWDWNVADAIRYFVALSWRGVEDDDDDDDDADDDGGDDDEGGRRMVE